MQESVYYDVHDLKLYELSDFTVPTWEDPVDAPGVSQVTVDAQVIEGVLRGDGKIIDTRTIVEAFTGAFTYGKLAPAVLAVIDGGTVSSDAGGTTDRYVRTSADRVPEWGFAALVSEVDNPDGAAKMYGARCRITGGSLFSAQSQQHGQTSFNFRGISLGDDAGDDPMFGLDLEDVGTALPATGAAFAGVFDALV